MESLDYVRGDSLARAQRFEPAKLAFQREIAAFPRNRQAYSTLAVLYGLGGDRRAVYGLLNEMYAQIPTRSTAEHAAEILERFGDGRGAAEWRAQALRTP